jgi:hypothetical protein
LKYFCILRDLRCYAFSAENSFLQH